MAMQVYTLNDVDTSVAPQFYSANQAFGTSKSLALTGVPAGAWGVFSFSWGFNGTGNTVTSSSGTPVYGQGLNNLPNFIGQDVLMGAVMNLSSGANTVSVGNPNGGGVQSALALAVFTSAGANTNIVTPQFSNLTSSPTVPYGTSSLPLSGRVSTNGSYLLAGTACMTVTIDEEIHNKQPSTIRREILPLSTTLLGYRRV